MEPLIPRYVAALCRDLVAQAAAVGERPVQSVFFGGGTPSLLSGEQVTTVMDALRDAYRMLPDVEVTLEANPNSADRAAFAGYREGGINRLSIGVQTADRRGLRVLGRRHEAADAEAAVEAAAAAGFEHISVDLIFGWPCQTAESWRRDLETVARWPIDHLSAYSLIIEPGTPMAEAVHRQLLQPLDDDLAGELYEVARDLLPAVGFAHYEVANWARSEHARSLHNRLYWRNGDFLGLGAGAHGTLAGRRTMNHLAPVTYMRAVESGELPHSNVETIDAVTARGETMMLGLRLLDEGVERAAFARRHGVTLDEVYGATIAELVGLGLLTDDGDRIRVTPRGLMVANDVCARFL
jgi:oxygen-independent coproporphyrinogen-3 oxidase